MNVEKLITELKKMPLKLEVTHIWDGTPRTTIEFVWLSKNKSIVVTADFNQDVYNDDFRPKDASGCDEDWQTPDGYPKTGELI